jgi:hypothetical protein
LQRAVNESPCCLMSLQVARYDPDGPSTGAALAVPEPRTTMAIAATATSPNLFKKRIPSLLSSLLSSFYFAYGISPIECSLIPRTSRYKRIRIAKKGCLARGLRKIFGGPKVSQFRVNLYRSRDLKNCFTASRTVIIIATPAFSC